MDTKEDALKLAKEVLMELFQEGTKMDEYYRKFREFRLLEDDLSFQSALLNVEHAFFMYVQSANILKEQLKLLEVASKKSRIV